MFPVAVLIKTTTNIWLSHTNEDHGAVNWRMLHCSSIPMMHHSVIPGFLSLGSIDIWDQTVLWWGLPCALWDVYGCPWPPPTDASGSPFPQN